MRNIYNVLSLLLILPVVLCSCVVSNDPSAKKHIIDFYDEDECVNIFSEEESEELLQIFNITIPDNENNAYIHSLARVEGDSSVTYFLNIDGVADYEAFFAANADVPDGSEVLTLSVNQIYGYTEADYYITYSQFFSNSMVEHSDEIKPIFEALNELYYD